MGRILIVQRIQTVWTKKSRGAQGAARRNACPEAVKVPQIGTEADGGCILHELTFGESRGFAAPPEKVSHGDETRPLTVGGVRVECAGGGLTAAFAWTWACGAPERGWARKTLAVRVNEWGQIVYNGRFTDWDAGDWWYEKTVVNVGLFEPPSSSVFTRGRATCRFRELADLW